MKGFASLGQALLVKGFIQITTLFSRSGWTEARGLAP